MRKPQWRSTCGTVAQYSVKTSLVITLPLMVTLPTLVPSRGSRVSRSISVVLPAPDGPKMASTPPLRHSPEMPFRMVLVPVFLSGTEYTTSSNLNRASRPVHTAFVQAYSE